MRTCHFIHKGINIFADIVPKLIIARDKPIKTALDHTVPFFRALHNRRALLLINILDMGPVDADKKSRKSDKDNEKKNLKPDLADFLF